ncbi:MAG: hypothetical protein ACPGXK_13720 [Phycisphaerae bacterium]
MHPKSDMRRFRRLALLQALGIVLVLTAIFGAVDCIFRFSSGCVGLKRPHVLFWPLWVMSITCEVLLFKIGIEFSLVNTRLIKVYYGVVFFELMFLASRIHMYSIESETGTLANDALPSIGLLWRLRYLVLIWGPMIAFWAHCLLKSDQEGAQRERIRTKQKLGLFWSRYGTILGSLLAVSFIFMAFAAVLAIRSSPFPADRLGLTIILVLGSAYGIVKVVRDMRESKARERRLDRLSTGLCPICEYPLKGLRVAVCPECGSSFEHLDVE